MQEEHGRAGPSSRKATRASPTWTNCLASENRSMSTLSRRQRALVVWRPAR